MGPSINGLDRILTIPQTGSNIAGYYNNPDQLPANSAASPNGCNGVSTCFGWSEPAARNHSQQLGLDRASEMRAEGVFIYSIGLGNPDLADPLWQPDLAYLAQIANVDGVSNPQQPKGKSYFAPSQAELALVFEQVASDLLARLAQ